MAAYSMNGATMKPGGSNGLADSNRQDAPEYTLAGVLHFLQSEWRRYERDRNAWAIERAELRARIALLEGEKRGVENVKNDFLRRIKMLEYALRQERFKTHANPPNSQGNAKTQSTTSPTTNTPQNEESGLVSSAVDPQRSNKPPNAPAFSQVRLPLGVKDAKGRAKSRAYLQQCLQEIAYLTSTATLNPLSSSSGQETDRPGPSVERPRLALFDQEAENDAKSQNDPSATRIEDPLSQEGFASEPTASERKEPNTSQLPPVLSQSSQDTSSREFSETISRNTDSSALSTPVHSLVPDPNTPSPVQSPRSVPDVQLWNLKGSVQAHFDSIRAVTFDLHMSRLFTASDDATIKHWTTKTSAGETQVDLLHTLRGHQAGVTCLLVYKERRSLYSGSMDGTVRVWSLSDEPESTTPSSSIPSQVLAQHPEAVWGMALFPSETQDEPTLGTVSSDGYVRIWSTQNETTDRCLLSWDYFGTIPTENAAEERARLSTLPTPTSITAIPSNLGMCAVSYSNGVVKTFALRDGHEMKRMSFEGTVSPSNANNPYTSMVVAHPTLPLVATAQDNTYIHMYDVMTGACTMSLHAHGDSVSCLDIDPSGLTLVSGSHDCTVRFWDTGSPDASDAMDRDAVHASQSHSAVCFQEIREHQTKGKEGVLAVVYHATAPIVASAGADGTLRLYG
ncbi:1,2-dihydroxy-3-keto-5-methylthiopentene dioxygenase [Malassezia yamatoensis]|uniref:1,2-dihydroxy-3-keto-5-methylthiopentene dioxygenase n=1 Tax=Malassezia yamatoensis TaxID=253288 RepID=A0AAJ5YVD0_9BASI|nr:1,2-dihydroxy-3-keto-5-methylthiopentene dioxygenase [Malassezia yamatoensis]